MIGDPISHSLSPRIHAAAIAAAGIEARYDRIRVLSTHLPEFVDRVRGGMLLGFNVTIPHKQRIAPMLDALDGGSAEIGAVNTVVRRVDGQLAGYNTDVAGFLAALDGIAPRKPRSALVLGSGGAARGVAYALVHEGVSVAVSGRSREASEAVAQSIGAPRVVPWSKKESLAVGCDLIVNATPLGMSHLADETPLARWPEATDQAIAFDLVYGRETLFLRNAREAGWQTLGGLEMLVQQAAESFRLWFGLEPDTQAMREACLEGEAACSAS